MKIGTTSIVLVECKVDTTKISKVIWTLKTPSSTITKEYPTDVTYTDGYFGIPLTQENTSALGVGIVKVEGQINFTDKAVSKTVTAYLNMEDSLATETVTGNKPNGETDITELHVKLVGEAIIATVDSSSGGGTWGSITGTLSNQTDLQTALNAKANTSQIPTVPTNVSAFTNDAGYVTSEINDNQTTSANTWSASKINQNLSDFVTKENYNKLLENQTTTATLEWLSGYWNTSGGYTANSSLSRSKDVSVKEGDEVTFAYNMWYGYPSAILLGENGVVNYYDAIGAYEEKTIVIPKNVNRIRINCLSNKTDTASITIKQYSIYADIKRNEYDKHVEDNNNHMGRNNVNVTFIDGKYFNGVNYVVNSGYSYSQPTIFYKGETIEYYANGGTVNCILYQTDENGVMIKEIAPNVTNAQTTYKYTVKNDVEWLVFNRKKYSVYTVTKYIDSNSNKVSSDYGALVHNDFYKYLFENVMCIGDSLTAGYFQDGTIRNALSYPTFLSKLLGWNVTNKGKSGASASTWYAEYGNTDYSNLDAVIICLGTNGGLTDSVEADTSTTPYANTNTGYYCRIVNDIMTQNPNCKIFLMGVLGSSGVATNTTNSVIEKIANKYNIAFCDWLNNPFYYMKGASDGSANFDYHPNSASGEGTHFGRIGYLTMARVFASMIFREIDTNKQKYELPY